ncbi:hypothetical protein M2132_001054 [Dysgonomonas sp. PH5-45]|uniref:hypothetical protein n=1 Tax=unclassified Dysgonomonas TaxID=2630389 RepID=UPI002475082E|nr:MULTISPECIES: hypothetical protein [unclassified Dysgonomonas]MDH6354725.1 hypothetical protein [Dysgonomonas sp. PH5-45]MDH6387624.1 hypothetical protein [Dysgonomonas sp. PH5-37]
METFYIQRGDDESINIYDKYKVDVKDIISLKNQEEVELGNSTALFNTIVEVAVHPNQMNLLSNLTSYISNRTKGQYDKSARGESKDGVFQLIDVDKAKGYRLSYISIRDTGKKDGKWKLLELLFLNELPQSTLDVSDGLFIGNSASDIYFSDGTFLKDIQNRYIPNTNEWALVVQSDGRPYETGTPVFGGNNYVENSQTVEVQEGLYILRCEISHNGQTYPISSYDMGKSWIMLKPLLQEFINRKEAILRFPADVPVMYYAKELLPEIELPAGFGMLESKDLLALQDILEQADMWNEFYNKNTLYGFVEYLALNTKTPRSAFWCKNKKGEVTGFQFIQKGFRIIVEHIHVEDYTYLPIIGIYRN